MRPGSMLLSVHVVVAVVGVVVGAPNEGSSSDLQDQTSNNAIPRMGRRADGPDYSSIIQAELARIGKRGPPLFAIPSHWREEAKEEDKRNAEEDTFRMKKWAGSWAGLMSPQNAAVKTSETKRAPWTGSWANIVYKPSSMHPEPSQGKRAEVKRSAMPNDWSNANWGNLMRTRQGFRLHDGGSDYLDNSVMYKRAIDPLMGNNVPLIGKRTNEQVIEKRDPTEAEDSSNQEDSAVYENPWSEYMGGGQDVGLMADSSLGHPHPGAENQTQPGAPVEDDQPPPASWLRAARHFARMGLPPRPRDILWNAWAFNNLNSG